MILAAGGSSRLGSPKQLARISGETLLDRAVRVAGEAGCRPVVILGANAELIRQACSLDGIEVILNPDWAEGMATSIRVGIVAVANAVQAVLMTCDQPAVTPEHLRRLIAASADGEVAASRYKMASGTMRNGVPACFPGTWFGQLMSLEGDAGARSLLRAARGIELPRGELDVDTFAELTAAQELFGEERVERVRPA